MLQSLMIQQMSIYLSIYVDKYINYTSIIFLHYLIRFELYLPPFIYLFAKVMFLLNPQRQD